jgi:hypothetical protein
VCLKGDVSPRPPHATSRLVAVGAPDGDRVRGLALVAFLLVSMREDRSQATPAFRDHATIKSTVQTAIALLLADLFFRCMLPARRRAFSAARHADISGAPYAHTQHTAPQHALHRLE